MNKLYHEVQYSKLLIILSGVIIASLMLPIFLEEGGKFPMEIIIITGIALLAITVIFGKLEITLTKESIKANFGLRFIKQEMKIEEMDFSSIENVSVPWIYGVGLRLTPQGTLYNTKFGSAIKIKFKDGKKTFFVGSENTDEIKRKIQGLS
ncbi:MAG TPA: hypothetical protein VFM70_10590 [Salinimicrobium sp.]|nr:hypothetical protein [Salinimicrobium sp.]